jgi:predicted RNA-binding Zn-ribbon protein involved in translation (DUF1610 family)
LNNFEYLLKQYSSKTPTIEEALIELFRNGGASPNEAKEIYNHLKIMCDKKINDNWDLIKQENKEISKDDAFIVSSYTYEPKHMYREYSPYRLLNTNLVSNDRKSGIINVEKYLFLFLRALRRMKLSKKPYLYRCISCKVKLENDPNNSKYIPYKVGNEKIFWPFTSTSYDENVSEKFLDNGKGTKYKIEGDDLWGYDITLFNVCNEKEVLLEPERKYVIEEVKNGIVTEITCKIIGNPKVLEICNKVFKPFCPSCGSEKVTYRIEKILNPNEVGDHKPIKRFINGSMIINLENSYLVPHCDNCGHKF